MLSELLAIKRRRERGLRTGLARLADDELRLCHRQEGLQTRRENLHTDWRILAAESGCFDQRGLEALRASLAKLQGEDQALQHQQGALVVERTQLAQARAEQEALLRRNLREQEKLTLLLENL